MGEHSESRFDAEMVVQSATVDEAGRLELRFRDAQGKRHVVSVPLDAAVTLARLICDMYESTPFLGKPAQSIRKQQ